MTELGELADQLQAIYYTQTREYAEANGKEQLLDWPHSEMLYGAISILMELNQLAAGGHFSREYVLEKCKIIAESVELCYCAKCHTKIDPHTYLKYCHKCLELRE